MTQGTGAGAAAAGAGSALLLGLRRPARRSLLAALLLSVCTCWLLLVPPPTPPHQPLGASGPDAAFSAAAAAAAAAAFPPREGPLPDPATWRRLSEQQMASLSALGRMLFLNETKNLTQKDRMFTVLIWKHGKLLESRHMNHFGTVRHDPFEDCSVSNCRIEYDDKLLPMADAVIFHLHQIKEPDSLPQRNDLNKKQRWIFLTDESPHNTFLFRSNGNNLKKYSGIFNWSMSYRIDSDVPVPYGRAVPLTSEEAEKALVTVPKNYAEGKTGVVAVMGSNCGGPNHRWDYVHQLQKYMQVDAYGGCGNLTCPGGFRRDCPSITKYKFYLAFENSNCKEYITEKVWWNAYKKNVVPIIMGAPQTDLRHFLPPKSYLHVDDFASPADLARFIIHLDKSDRDYNTYFEWKYKYKILNEHGYFQSQVYHYCRVCEALNYNNPAEKVYDHPEEFINPKKDCRY